MMSGKNGRFKHSENQSREDWNYGTQPNERRGVLKNVGAQETYHGMPMEKLGWDELPPRIRVKLRRMFEDIAPCVLYVEEYVHGVYCVSFNIPGTS